MRNVIVGKDKITIDSGYFFARGVFETILVKEKPIFLEKHINRLNNGINTLQIGELVEVEDINNLIKDFNIENCALKIVVTEKNIVLETRELVYKSGDYLRGFSLKIAGTIKNSTSKLTYIKSMNYLENILEREEATKEGYNEVIFLNEKGYVCDGSLSNIFIVKNGTIFTPKVSSGLLPGIVRDYVIRNHNVIEKEINLDEIMNADEIFITNSLLGIMGVSKFENRILTENKITIKIREEYEAQIENRRGV
ncbi:aminotransferase class IV [Clostridium tertium]|uniref:aminotransferase class IV n=2 Tax=Clostridium TaxID=1485 RepID=UPI0024B330E7|nr:aminotransferase class IV [Clostridium tertium]MDI9216453.1 aminotransferase class IV [Clostridium tertium]